MTGIVEAIDVTAKGQLGLNLRLITCSPDQFGSDDFEDRLDPGAVVTVAPAAH